MNGPRELPLAAVPLFFASQQAIEGFLWLQFENANDASRIAALSFAFLSFAKVFWPIYTPLAVLLVEGDRRRRYVLFILALVGLGLSIDLLIDLVENPAIAAIRGDSIAYVSGSSTAPVSLAGLASDAIPYFVCTGMPLFVSSHKAIRVFGVVVLIGFAVAAFVYIAAFVSVWCFFAAADSTVLYFYFRRAAFETPVHHAR